MRRLADVNADTSFSNRRRTQRFAAFERVVEDVRSRTPHPVRVLDVGGTRAFWEHRGWAGRSGVEITIVNLEPEIALWEGNSATYDNIDVRAADATDLSAFADQSFDVVFSNSVIEHLQTLERQAAMAAEVRRLAPTFWIQTPNFWFPMEPHFLTLAWHWLPVNVRIALLMRRGWGWAGRCTDVDEARELVLEIRLMRGGELRRLFPGAELKRERIGPFVKSFVALQVAARADTAHEEPARGGQPAATPPTQAR